MNRKAILTIFLIFLACCFICAEEKGFGTSGLDILSMELGSRPSALGAYTALSDTVDAVGHNPAGLAFVRNPEITAMHSEWFVGTRYEYLGFAMPVSERDSIGINLMYFYSGLETMDIYAQATGNISIYDIVAMFGYGGYTQGMFFGFTLKYASENLHYLQKSALLINLGVIYGSPETPVSMGITGENITLTKSENCEGIPYSVKFGLAFRMIEKEYNSKICKEKYDLSIAGDLIIADDYNLYYAGGAEYAIPFSKRFELRLRGGVNTKGKTFNTTAGLGIYFEQFILEYAMSMNELGTSYKPQLTYRF